MSAIERNRQAVHPACVELKLGLVGELEAKPHHAVRILIGYRAFRRARAVLIGAVDRWSKCRSRHPRTERRSHEHFSASVITGFSLRAKFNRARPDRDLRGLGYAGKAAGAEIS